MFFTGVVMSFMKLVCITYPLVTRCRANCNVTIIAFVDQFYGNFLYGKSVHQMLHKEIFPRNPQQVNFVWLKANETRIDRSRAGVLAALSFIQNQSTSVNGALFIGVTREQLVLSSLLENVNILTFGVFQDESILQTQVTEKKIIYSMCMEGFSLTLHIRIIKMVCLIYKVQYCSISSVNTNTH